MPFFSYLLQCADDSFYAGWTTNIENRLEAHNSGKASRYTRSRLPVQLAYVTHHASRSEAMKNEAILKNKTHREKKQLMDEFHAK